MLRTFSLEELIKSACPVFDQNILVVDRKKLLKNTKDNIIFFKTLQLFGWDFKEFKNTSIYFQIDRHNDIICGTCNANTHFKQTYTLLNTIYIEYTKIEKLKNMLKTLEHSLYLCYN